MQAIVLQKHGTPGKAFSLEEREVPEPRPHEILIRSAASGINFADIMARKGLYRDAPPLPCILGYEVAGTVAATGSDVEGFKEGQRVLAFTRFGGYAGYAISLPEATIALPESIDFTSATALATQYCTAWYAAHEATNIRLGDRVLVEAASGGVGTALVQMAKQAGCIVYGTTGSEHKLEYLSSLGVDVPVHFSSVHEYKNNLQEALKGERLDVVFNSTGGRYFKAGQKLLGSGGRMVCFGGAERMQYGGGLLPTLRFLWHYGLFHPIMLLVKSQGVLGVNMLRIADHRPEVLQRCLQGVMQYAEKGIFTPHIDEVFAPADIATAHRKIEERKAKGKVVIEW